MHHIVRTKKLDVMKSFISSDIFSHTHRNCDILLAILGKLILVFQSNTLLLPSKENINPEIPLDEQTDALPYDIIWEFPVGKLKLGMLLGQGEFGRVFKAVAVGIEDGLINSTVAVKAAKGNITFQEWGVYTTQG